MSISYDKSRAADKVKFEGRSADNALSFRPASKGAGEERPFVELDPGERLRLAYGHLEAMRRLNGGYLSGHSPGEEGADRCDSIRLRDVMYAAYANEYVGAYDRMVESHRLIMNVFLRSRQDIARAVRRRTCPGDCADGVVPAAVHSVTLEGAGGGRRHLLDLLGLFLFRTGELVKRGFGVMGPDRSETLMLLRDIVLYLSTVRWSTEPDFGLWEEGPDLHSSSVGSVLAGLTMWHDDGYYDYRYAGGVPLHDYLPVPGEFIEAGRGALDRLLPAESPTRPYDLAQLSLVWPYAIVNDSQALGILENVETGLVRKRGVVRYHGDMYFNSDEAAPGGNEAEWPLGFAWLSAAYSEMALRAARLGGIFSPPAEYIEKAETYIERLESVMTADGRVPELYSGGQASSGAAFAWGQGLYVVARQMLALARERPGGL
ncbi:MAG: hypothetical protein ACE5EI_09485 [Thermodesulfobacteriota bacterium]